MNKKLFIVFVVLIFSALVLTACGGGSNQPAAEGGNEGGESSGAAAPAPYAGKTNPNAGNADAAAKGKTLYDANCTSCHGADAKGDGPAAASLNPKPANLTDAIKENKEDFIFYRISEGGQMAPFNSAMPAFKDSLSEDERWQVVTYLETLK